MNVSNLVSWRSKFLVSLPLFALKSIALIQVVFHPVVVVSLSLSSLSVEAQEYCEPSQQEIRNFVVRDPLAFDETKLLKKGETPNDLQKLVLQPGPYGHSELGFRYLSKFFGYEGENYSVEEVEAMILRAEHFSSDGQKGAFDVWKAWVVEPKKRLSVPRGSSEDLPKSQVTNVFFNGLEDKAKFAKCLSDALAKSACSSTPHLYRNQFMPNDRLTVARSSKEGKVKCLVTLSEGTRILKELDAKTRRGVSSEGSNSTKSSAAKKGN